MLRRLLLLLLILLLAAVAVYLLTTDEEDTGGDDTVISAEEGPGVESQLSTAPMIDLTGRLLTWVGDGRGPGDFDQNRPGSLLVLTPLAEADSALRPPAGTRRVAPCTEQAASPDGTSMLIYVGGAQGRIYQWTGEASVATVDADAHAMNCLGMGTVQYAPDSSRFGYIDYPESAAFEENPVAGTLRVLNTVDRGELLTFENTVGFDVNDTAVAIAGLFADETQIGILHWTEGTPTEVSTLLAEEDCTYRMASVTFIDDESLAVLAAQACINAGSRWTLDTVDISGRSTTRITEGRTEAGYFGQARVNNLFVSPDGTTAYFTVPNGEARQLADMIAISLVEPADPIVLFESGVMPRFVPGAGQRITPDTNALPIVSPDGAKLAVASNTLRNDAAINLIDMGTAGDAFAVTIGADRSGHTVSAMAFTPDSSTLLYVMGEHSGGNNSLWALDVDTGVEERLVRDRFGSRMIVAQDGTSVALGNWQTVSEPRPAEFMNLVSVTLADNNVEQLLAGAEAGDEGLRSQRFFYPLWWR